MILPHIKLFCLRDLLYPPDVPTLAIAFASSPSCMNPRSPPVVDGAREGHFLARFMPPLAGSPPPTCPTAAAAPRPRCRFSTQSPPRQGARTRRRPRLPAGVGRTRVHRSYNKQLPPASLACCGCRPCLFAPPHRRCVGPHSSEDVAAGGLPGRPRAPPPLHGRLPLRHSRSASFKSMDFPHLHLFHPMHTRCLYYCRNHLFRF